MTIAYSPTVPNPPNDPADDVATMQSNAAAIGSIIAIDHVGFNVSGSGQHNQVTFNANNVPTPPVSPPILFTDLPSNHGGSPTYPQLFFYSGNSTQSSSQYVLGGTGNGSTILTGGIIMKWFALNVGGSGTGNVSFASLGIADFPNSVFGAQITSTNTGFSFAVSNLTTALINIGKSPGSGNVVVYVTVLGN